jgi:Asp-tRNA(Asn)/Glu-tRNA(Gln) amidotransferase A subunit family amidase
MDEKYDLKSIDMPRYSGAALKLITRLTESPATRWILLNQLLESGGINRLRGLQVDDPPTFQPNPPFSNTLASALPASAYELPGENKPHGSGFLFNTVSDYRAAYRSGKMTPEMVAEQALSAIEDSNHRDPALRAIIACNKEDVMTQARAATQRLNSGLALSILDGVPVAVKDEVDMIPYGTSGGTCFLGKTPAQADSTVVARMRSAGALLIGKANMHEIGIGTTGCNESLGTARNPYETSHHTGGSSSGPCAAVAAGLSPLAIGADGGGSIRIPSAFCGLVGLKPTFGRVSEIGALPLTWSLAHLGPIAATAHDTALGYAILAGPDLRDPNTLRQPSPTLEGFENLDLSDLTFGIYWPWFRHAAPEIVLACEETLRNFQHMGAKVREIEIPELNAALTAHLITITSEMSKGLESAYNAHRDEFSLETRFDLALARTFTARDYLQAQRIRTRVIAHFEQAFQQINIILTPSTAITAPMIHLDAPDKTDSDIHTTTEIMRFAITSNLTGHPAISFPVGYDSHGLPIGMQAIGRYWEEHVLLRLAHAAEQFVERRAPQVYYKLLPV